MASPRRPFALLLAIIATATCPTGARAQTYSYQWADTSGNALGSTLSVGAGTTFTLNVYVVESGATALTTNGLFSAGVRARYYDPTVAGTTSGVLTVAGTSAITRNTAFDDAAVFTASAAVSNPNYAQFREATTVATTGVHATANRVLLGSFTVQATSTANQSTLLSAIDIPTTTDTIVATSGTSLDSFLANNPANITITIAPVPEPAGVLLVGCLLATAARRLCRKVA